MLRAHKLKRLGAVAMIDRLGTENRQMFLCCFQFVCRPHAVVTMKCRDLNHLSWSTVLELSTALLYSVRVRVIWQGFISLLKQKACCASCFENSNMYLHSLKAYSNSSSVLGKVKGGSSFFISSSKSILDSKSEEKERKGKIKGKPKKKAWQKSQPPILIKPKSRFHNVLENITM